MRKHHTLDDEIERQLRDHALQYKDFSIPFTVVAERSSNDLKREIQRIISIIRNEKIPFPLTRFWYPVEKLQVCYKNLKEQNPEWINRSHEKLKGHPIGLWLPTNYRGETCHLLTQANDWWNIDICVDYFTEYERIRCRKDYSKSLWTQWQDDVILEKALMTCKGEEVVDCKNMRDGMFMMCRELALFRASRAKHLINKILGVSSLEESSINVGDNIPRKNSKEVKIDEKPKRKRWLDISAGWGDRLMAACALDMDYLGFDPNERLRFGHGEMLKMFGSENHRVIYQPFESPQSEKIVLEDVRNNGQFDICLGSPPFFTIEKYEGAEQSVENYPKLEDWLINFLFKSLDIAWSALRVGGFLAINIADIRGCEIVEPMLLFILSRLKQASWMGMLPFSGRGTQDVPAIVYVWQKVADDEIPVRPIDENRTLASAYPRLERRWTSVKSPRAN